LGKGDGSGGGIDGGARGILGQRGLRGLQTLGEGNGFALQHGGPRGKGVPIFLTKGDVLQQRGRLH